MNARATRRVLLSAVLGGLMAASTVGAVSADEFVNATSVTFDKIAYIYEAGTPAVVVSGTMTCDATGPAVEVYVNITQRQATGYSNSELLDFACSTEPRAFTITLEGWCDDEVRDPECFRPGRATIRAYVGGITLTEETVLIKRRR